MIMVTKEFKFIELYNKQVKKDKKTMKIYPWKKFKKRFWKN